MNQKLRFKDGHVEIHYQSAGPADVSLCGQDLLGDTDWYSAKPTNRRVDCATCLRIVEYCKTL